MIVGEGGQTRGGGRRRREEQEKSPEKILQTKVKTHFMKVFSHEECISESFDSNAGASQPLEH